ncbi:MAG: metallophosphoesterase [Armatimonadetes bacterium]|nr:metallophosphoesterase [Armatimonadota bacterium]
MRFQIARVIALLVLILLVASCEGGLSSPAAGSNTGNTHILIEWSDIHFTTTHPYFVPEAWNVAAAQGIAAEPEIVVLGGDILDDNTGGSEQLFVQFADAFLPELAATLDQLGRPAPITLGNEDLYLDYNTDPDVLAVSFAKFRQHLGSRFYLDGLGNGVFPEPLLGMKWISVNSVLFSPNNDYEGRAGQAQATFDWLRRELLEDPSGPVVILAHIPPTADLYNQTAAWNCADLEQFVSVLSAHPGPILILGGHFHRNEVHALAVPGHEVVPILLAGSTSAKYGNLPNWRTYRWTLRGDGALAQVDYDLHYPQNPALDSTWIWSNPFRASTWQDFVETLALDPVLYRRYGLDVYSQNASAEQCLSNPVIREALLNEVWAPPQPCPPEPGVACPD